MLFFSKPNQPHGQRHILMKQITHIDLITQTDPSQISQQLFLETIVYLAVLFFCKQILLNSTSEKKPIF